MMSHPHALPAKRAPRALFLLAGAALALAAHAPAQTLPPPFLQPSSLPAPGSRASARLVGSWLLRYSVAAFGPATVPILNSFTAEGIVVETDTPAPTPVLASLGTFVVSNGHGAWRPVAGRPRTYAYTYVKAIYSVNGPGFATSRTNLSVTVSKDGTWMSGTLDITFTDNNGNVLFTSPGTLTGERITVPNP